MITILLVTHGHLAEAMIESAEMLIGKTEGLESLCLLPGESFDAFDKKVKTRVQKMNVGDGVLVCVDLLGGSPYNAAAFNIHTAGMEGVTGLNLGMLLTALEQRPYCTLKQLAAASRQAAIDGVVDIREELSTQTEAGEDE